MKDLSDLYSKPMASTAPEAPAFTAPAPAPQATAAPDAEEKKQSLDVPPGLPQEYIDANLINQPLPPVLDMSSISMEKAKPLNVRLLPNESLINATDIPYTPGYEPKVVRERIEQGPRVFVTSAQREKFEKDFDEKTQAPISKKAPTLAHPDTLRPGTHIKGDSPVYRPV
jgi:hypothetical protein